MKITKLDVLEKIVDECMHDREMRTIVLNLINSKKKAGKSDLWNFLKENHWSLRIDKAGSIEDLKKIMLEAVAKDEFEFYRKALKRHNIYYEVMEKFFPLL